MNWCPSCYNSKCTCDNLKTLKQLYKRCFAASLKVHKHIAEGHMAFVKHFDCVHAASVEELISAHNTEVLNLKGDLACALTDLSDAREEVADSKIRCERVVSAAYHALLEMSAWMGISEAKRTKQIEYLMENVRYCAEHDLRTDE